jgi:hypothetical protein
LFVELAPELAIKEKTDGSKRYEIAIDPITIIATERAIIAFHPIFNFSLFPEMTSNWICVLYKIPKFKRNMFFGFDTSRTCNTVKYGAKHPDTLSMLPFTLQTQS